MTIFYAPVVVYIVGLVIRYRGLTFTAVNPGLPGSGFIGENKSDSLLTLQRHSPETTAKTYLIECSASLEEKCLQSQQFMQQHALSYPVVLKPDFGQRGIDVDIVHNQTALSAYLATATFDTVLQEYVAGV
ncbi:MAG: carbamoylphosphate synthase large subunit, partial [Granulosicoccus sp.]